jgi:6-phosphogluconolactonase
MTGMEHSSRRSFLAQLSVMALAARTRLWASEPTGLIFVGTYTNDKGSTSKGIYAFRWDADEGTLAPLGLAGATVNPSFLTLSPNRKYLYAVNEVDHYGGQNSGSVTSFAVSESKLKAIDTVSSDGGGPCKITLDLTGKAAVVANYDGGSVASFRVLRNGELSRAVSRFRYSGHGADPQRQPAPHPRCTAVSPDNRYVLVSDLGLDRISVYHLDPFTAALTPNDPPFYEALPGSGPGRLVFHPTGKWAYSLNEIANIVDVLAWDAEGGVLTSLQNISTLPEGNSGSNTTATVAVDSAGRFVYASNRGDNSIAVFSIDDHDGKLKPVQRMDCGGKTPRHFTFDPGNEWLLVANEDTSNIVVFARNTRSGLLTPTGREYPVSHPACIVFP